MDTDEDDDESSLVFRGNNLEAAKQFVVQNYADGNGVLCPCCNQRCKLYKRKLTPSMIRALYLINEHFEQNPQHEWVHLAGFLVRAKPDSTTAGGDVAKLRYWGLIERVLSPEDLLGRYGITEIGKQFVRGNIAVPGYLYVFNGEVLGPVPGIMVTYRQVLNGY